MNKKYIEINKDTFPTFFKINPSDFARGWNSCLNSIMQHKTVDVEPVRHGKWIPHTNSLGEPYEYECFCSECKEDGMIVDNYCRYCGAKMDKEE